MMKPNLDVMNMLMEDTLALTSAREEQRTKQDSFNAEVSDDLFSYFESKSEQDILQILIENNIASFSMEYRPSVRCFRLHVEGDECLDIPSNWGPFQKIRDALLQSHMTKAYLAITSSSDEALLIPVFSSLVPGVQSLLLMIHQGSLLLSAFTKENAAAWDEIMNCLSDEYDLTDSKQMLITKKAA